MRKIGLVLVQGSPKVRALALAGAHQAFSGAKIAEVGTIGEAERLATVDETEAVLLLLSEPTATVVRRAVAACDAAGFPRWAVVVLGRGLFPMAETLPPEEWSTPAMARVFLTALRLHGLRAEVLRLRGDLHTVAKRITHDFRTPLSSILTACEVLAERTENDLVSVAEMNRIIRESSMELAGLVDRLGLVLKASLGPWVPAPVKMGAVVAAVLRQLEPDIQSGRATFSQPHSWPEVTGVAKWLEVVWWNLLKNALQHGGPAAQVQIAWKIAGGECRFLVADHGPGVAAAQRSALFSPFDQLHERRSNGLGLSVVRRLVDLHAGTCGHETNPGGGACFFFTLPLHPIAGQG